MSLLKMASDMRVPLSYINLIARTADYRYKVYRIKKRTKGTREISHPAKVLKGLQRWVADNVFANLPVHDSVFSYRRGRGIKDHAGVHTQQNYLLRIDLKDFFPSITDKDVARLVKANRGKLLFPLSANDLGTICKIVCRQRRLTIGAPSSPVISNAVLYEFDKHWAKLCKKREIFYSRYADDIYLSTNIPNVLREIYSEMRNDLEGREWPKFRINTKKVVFTSRKHNRNVTGLTLTADRKISIGRDKKRSLRSQVFKFSLGQLSEKETSYLRGYLAYVHSVEPGFLQKLKKKYGKDVVHQIAKVELIAEKVIKSRKK